MVHFPGMRIATGIDENLKSFQGGVVTIGNFDGVHLGHQSLLKKAESLGGASVVITFEPHPLKVLKPEQAPSCLFPREDLAEQLPRFGVDLLLLLPFTPEFAQTSAEGFWRQYIREAFRPQHVVAGHDFGFGHDRGGTLTDLDRWAKADGATLHVLPPLEVDGSPVSSRRIRSLVEAGEMREVARLLGRPFYLRGPIVSGAARGRQIGFPTLNQDPLNEIRPALGVYATRVRWKGQEPLKSVTNVGVNPTFGGDRVKVETHVIGRKIEAPTGPVDVDFIARLRPEMKFSSVEDLKKQIQSDILKAQDEEVDVP